MKTPIKLIFAMALAGVLLSACTSMRTRYDTPRENWSIYPGVRKDITEIGSAFRGELRTPAWVNGVVAPILLVDLPVSATFDTVALPYDLCRVYHPKVTVKSE